MDPVDAADVARAVARIERVHGVAVLCVADCGSHAWGYATPRSDYDLRGVFVRPPAAYLSLSDRRDVLYWSAEDRAGRPDIGFVLWDIRHFLGFCAASKPAAFELLYSPLPLHGADFARRLADTVALSPLAIARHYMRQHYGNCKDLDGASVPPARVLSLMRLRATPRRLEAHDRLTPGRPPRALLENWELALTPEEADMVAAARAARALGAAEMPRPTALVLPDSCPSATKSLRALATYDALIVAAVFSGGRLLAPLE